MQIARPVVGLLVILAVASALGGGAGGGGRSLAVAISCAPATPAAGGFATPLPATAVEPVAFPEEGGALTVFAAASLTDGFTQIKRDLEAAHPRLTITYNFAGSQTLVTQLIEGAPADLFAAAGPEPMADAIAAGAIAGPPVIFTRNRLAIVVPKENPGAVHSAADLARDGLKLVLAQAEVPAGLYARQAICAAGRDTATYGAGFVEAVAANVVSEEDNVRAVLTKVQLGEADAGIVYRTDVTADMVEEVTLIEIPAAINAVASYAIAPVAEGNVDLATAFIAYLVGPAGQSTLQQFGFEPEPSSGLVPASA